MSRRPGGELASRPLHFIWIADSSGSMEQDGKIQALNTAIREAIPHMRKVAEDNPNAQVLVRAVKFSNGAQWHLSQPTPVADFAWTDLAAEGETDMGKALQLVAEQLKMPPMSERALPPVLVLVSDGQPTDDFDAGLKALMNEPWGKKAVRIAISIGRDADDEVLQKFIGNSELKPLAANSPEALVRHIKWASTAVLKSASSPAAGADAPAAPTPPSVPIPTAAPAAGSGGAQAAATAAPGGGQQQPADTDADNQKTIDDVW
ncbi:MAG TPA: VWA domain-containing protein [Pyrinomonadaceae bacterium]